VCVFACVRASRVCLLLVTYANEKLLTVIPNFSFQFAKFCIGSTAMMYSVIDMNIFYSPNIIMKIKALLQHLLVWQGVIS